MDSAAATSLNDGLSTPAWTNAEQTALRICPHCPQARRMRAFFSFFLCIFWESLEISGHILVLKAQLNAIRVGMG